MTQPLPSPTQPIHKTQRFEDFYRLFQDKPGVFKYQDQINKIIDEGGNTLIILFEDLLSYDSQIAEMLKNNPEALLEDAIDAFKNVIKLQSGSLANQKYFLRIITKDEKSPLKESIRSLRSKHIDKLVWFKGILVRISTVRPKLTIASFECQLCGATLSIPQLTSKARWPKFCNNKRCKAKANSDFRLISRNSEFIDWQSITIQEVPEDLPPGRIPRSVQAILTYDLVDIVKPGDRINVMGVFKSVLAQSIKGLNSTLFKTYIDVNFIDPEDKGDEFIDISKEDIQKIENLSKEPMIQKKIARSISPTIYGRDDLKMACALSLFGGTRRPKPGGGFKRGDVHILFVGDPGTGKSIHRSEKIYIGSNKSNGTHWNVDEIGNFVDRLIQENKKNLFLKGDSEILRLSHLPSLFTASIDPDNLKTQKSKIKEVSRHKTSNLIKIQTESGRSILSTPDHSYSTLVDGELKVVNAEVLYKMYENSILYLPIARRLQFDTIQSYIDISLFFKEEELVSSQMVCNQLSLYENGCINSVIASMNSNISKSTVLLYNKDASSIPDGDWIRRKLDCSWIPRKIPLNVEFGEIIGLYLAEGDVPKISIRITNTNEIIVKKLKQNFINLFGKVSSYKYDNSVQFHNSSLSIWFKKKFGTHAENKKLPHEFLFTPLEFRRGLISGYFSGDGTVEKDKLYIDALTVSKELAFSISDMLNTFGIFSTIGTKVLKSGEYEGNTYYKVILTGEEVIKFYNHIGFIAPEKQDRLKYNISLAKTKSRYQKKDIIPNFGNILINITRDLKLRSIRGTEDRSLLGELRGKTQRQRCGRQYLVRLVEKFEQMYEERNEIYGEDLLWLKKLTSSDILWDKVVNIENINEPNQVYDIGTEDGHFIVANGNIITHNSEILKSVVDISPRGLYTSGKGSSGVGLTAAVIKDTETGQMNLEAGAVVLANGGIAAVDEFDKMDKADRSALHEAMAQQTVSIAKAGIVATLKSQTAIIAAANPYTGRFNEYKSFTENTNMPPSLLSRFDLIFKVIDRPDPANDAQMAEFILQSAMLETNDFLENTEDSNRKLAPINLEILKKYIKHARRNFHPILTEEAKGKIKDFYLDLRGQYNKEDAIVSILARNLDALVRMSEAYAKMALRTSVLEEDVEEIIKLFKRYLKDTGYDKETKKFDVDMILMGQSRSKTNKLTLIYDHLKKLFEESNWKALEKKNVIEIIEFEENIDKEFIKNAIEEGIKEGTMYEPKPNFIKFTRKQDQ